MKIEKLLKLAKEHDAEFVDLKLCDLLGTWHHITLPISSLDQKLFKTGVGVDGSSLPGFSSIERGDMIVLPDADTAFIDPFFDRPTVSMICDIMDASDKIMPFSRNPRRVAAAAEKYLAKTVKGARAIMGPEFEFYVFDAVNFYEGPQIAFYRVESAEGKREAAEDNENLGYKIPYKKGYHVAPPHDRSFNLRSEIASILA
ncbi:MAG: glutamine synthetase beta-grasp domain-containing protein, partial [bacterium]